MNRLLVLAAICAVLAGCYFSGQQPDNCAAKLKDLEQRKLAAEICTARLVGCNMTYAEVLEVVRLQSEADKCKLSQ